MTLWASPWVGVLHAGGARPYSDVDIACFVRDAVKPPRKRFFYRDGLLVSVGAKTVAGVRADLAKPERVFLFTAGRRRVLLDKDGSIAQLMHEVDTFS